MSKLNLKIHLSDEQDKKNSKVLQKLINRVYKEAEGNLFHPGIERIAPDEIINLIDKNELILAECDDRLVGCIHVCLVTPRIAKFGMLAVDFPYRRFNIGRELVDAAESWALRQGCSIMQLDLLTPCDSIHPHKEFLKKWYVRSGYVPQFTKPFEKESFLAAPCDFTVYYKQLKN